MKKYSNHNSSIDENLWDDRTPESYLLAKEELTITNALLKYKENDASFVPYRKGRSRQVIDTSNGTIYNSMAIAAKAHDICVQTLRKYLLDYVNNDTSLRWYD